LRKVTIFDAGIDRFSGSIRFGLIVGFRRDVNFKALVIFDWRRRSGGVLAKDIFSHHVESHHSVAAINRSKNHQSVAAINRSNCCHFYGFSNILNVTAGTVREAM